MANVQRVKLVVILIRNVRQIVLENRACIHSDDCATEECCNSDDKCGRLQCRIKVYSWLDCCSDCYQCYCCYRHTYCMQLSCFAVVVRPHRQQPRDILLMHGGIVVIQPTTTGTIQSLQPSNNNNSLHNKDNRSISKTLNHIQKNVNHRR